MQKRFDPKQRLSLLSNMILIRAFEDKITELAHAEGRLPGMQITCHGQEAIAAGVVQALKASDVIVTNHRSHGHMLARGVDPKALMAEIMGKKDGLNQGKSGTLHLADPSHNVLMTSTVVGAAPLLAMGAAFAQQYRKEETATCVFLGDGSAAEGSVHEAMNMAALWKLPVLFVCESNGWAGAQAHDEHCPISRIVDRAPAYGMTGEIVDGNDVEAVFHMAARLLHDCRKGRGPALLECQTYRMHGHGEHDSQYYVDKAELAAWAKRDPIICYAQALREAGVLESTEAFEREAKAQVEAAVAFADASPYPLPEEALDHVYVNSFAREG
ncbi:thiamine pyrophosphate-dependent dehydrogenase E1 component subunit alpha [Desulfococcaceae bacterium OttesenSCG-928-F15]|nr:thiamine pyrophosphate-dependent dehydrogenase E1 component subunit alpha [Desulfococcaceae bacterium OttesenSCG-928-F15]